MARWDLSLYSEKKFTQAVASTELFLHSTEKNLPSLILDLQQAGKTLCELTSYTTCLLAQNPLDPIAQIQSSQVNNLQAEYEQKLSILGYRLRDLPKTSFQALLQKEFPSMAFFLKQLYCRAQLKAGEEKEEVITALLANGYHSFWNLYQTLTHKMQIGEQKLSVAQACNFFSDPNRTIRRQIFVDWTEAWKKEADLLAQFLNYVAGFRLEMYKVRNWKDPLLEPLFSNQMEPSMLEGMWAAIQEIKPLCIRYLKHKAQLLGLSKLSWVDRDAPLGYQEKISLENACQSILTCFTEIHPKKGLFIKEALKKNWIETDDRPDKTAGAFCVFFPHSCESRIFMSYKDTFLNFVTFAHELGHAYHNECLQQLPFFAQQISSSLAETAATFSEQSILDYKLERAESKEQKRALLDHKLQRSVLYLMDIQTRFFFEKSFYEERKKGFVSVEKLCSLMLQAQKEAFGDALEEGDPYFWASKLHFYYTKTPFYNFSYTFGYLMSQSLYTEAKKGNFAQKLDSFLADTGQMDIETLAQKHLGQSLTSPSFWKSALSGVVADIQKFISI